ncbi:MAG: hypothetical protein ACRC3J_09610, partial [Culicoidibacterales bacterium]
NKTVKSKKITAQLKLETWTLDVEPQIGNGGQGFFHENGAVTAGMKCNFIVFFLQDFNIIEETVKFDGNERNESKCKIHFRNGCLYVIVCLV